MNKGFLVEDDAEICDIINEYSVILLYRYSV